MKKITLENYRTDKYYPKIVRAVDAALRRENFVAPIHVFVSMDLVEKGDLNRWRNGQVRFLELVVKCNLAQASRILRILRFHAHDLNLKPSITVYRRKTKHGQIPLRFSKSGARHLEEAYSRHFVKLGRAGANNHELLSNSV